MKHVPASLLWITLAAMPVSFLAHAQDAQANGVILKAEHQYPFRRGSNKA